MGQTSDRILWRKQQLFQLLPPFAQAGFDRSLRDAQHGGGFLHRIALHVIQHQWHAQLFRESQQRVVQPSLPHGLRGDGALGQLLGGLNTGAAPLNAVALVEQHAHHPGLQIALVPQLTAFLPALAQRFLHRILTVAGLTQLRVAYAEERLRHGGDAL